MNTNTPKEEGTYKDHPEPEMTHMEWLQKVANVIEEIPAGAASVGKSLTNATWVVWDAVEKGHITKDQAMEFLEAALDGATCSASFTPREIQQALGPHRPRARVLAAMLDTIPSRYEIEEIVVNGQTGKILVVCWDGKGTTYRQFNSLANV